MVNLSVEEPYALMRARTALCEPWAGNCPGPPGHDFVPQKRCITTVDWQDEGEAVTCHVDHGPKVRNILRCTFETAVRVLGEEFWVEVGTIYVEV
jgi:hypothetical protein